ncbi:MAG: thioester reductase domain-containing protein [Synechococcales cyanobacterium M58_A2018_015]|nr:thioester reductase domain-containing protein [Synechococcales cyanobacterium M58_A2018_015]
MPLLTLKPNAIAEPLFNQWYAWSYLIPPASAALYIADSHLKILESFIESPHVHQAALANPAMRGGLFIHYDASRVPELAALLAKTRRDQADLLELAQAIQTLDRLLQRSTGESLEPLYAQVPPALQGYVELVYDRHHHASMRLIEGLLYNSPYYRLDSQAVALYIGHDDSRSFVLSTPRLEDPHSLHLSIPFCDPRLDQLFRMRQHPGDYLDVRDSLNITDDRVFASLFTDATTAVRFYPPSEDVVRIRYFGHACVLIETQQVSILCDPLLGYHNQSTIPRYSFSELPETIDYVLITHNHQDHVMFETLLQLRYKIRTVLVPKSNKGSLIDPSLKLILQTIGFTQVQEVDELEQIELPEGYIASLPVLGEHGDLNIGAKTAYWIHLQGRSILCAADSNNIESQLYAHIAQQFGPLDVLFLGMECDGAPYTWAYGPLLPHPVPRQVAQSRRLDGSDADRAIQMVQQLQPRQVYIYAMGQEPWLTHITSIVYTATSRPILESNRLIEHCRQQGMVSERLLGCREMILERQSPLPRHRERMEPSQSSILQREGEQAGEKAGTGAVDLPASSVPAAVADSPPIHLWLAELAKRDIRFSLQPTAAEPTLKCNAPKGTLTPDLQAQLKQRKLEIIQFLTRQTTQPQIDWAAEAVLDPAIQPAPTWAPSPATRILLTGATGFLGTFLLAELLRQTEADIDCLVRADSLEQARQKLKASLTRYGMEEFWQQAQSRIVPIVGDLAQPDLGLTPDTWQALAAEIDAIYHNGAWVQHTSPYAQLKATNVLGTQTIIRLAAQERTKPLHFISTISVFAANHPSGVQIVRETEPLDPTRVPSSGYAQSKWVAEALVWVSQARGLPVTIYRPGAVAGHSQTGVFNANDFLYRLIQGCIQLRCAPLGEIKLNFLPVDYVSRTIVYLSRQPSAINQAFHLIHPQPASSDMLFDVLEANGYSIRRLPYAEWRMLLLDIAQHSPEHPLYAIAPLFATSHTQSQSDNLPVLEFDTEQTDRLLQHGAISCPAIDRSLLNVYLTYLSTHGLISQPQLSNTA